jgi:MSHA biogenesis protein MshJ
MQEGRLGEQLAEVQSQTIRDPNAPVRERISSLNNELASLDNQLQQQTSQLVPANQMANMLEGVLEKSKGITLIELSSIAPSPIYLSKVVEGQVRQPDLYRHGVKLILEGGYFDIYEYLQTLESLSWQFFWTKFDYQVDAYPKGKIELEIYTLSTSKAFIGV